MNKFLKLTGVSMLAVIATANANAAGYTCEELIEYTSCNAGYYLTTQDSRCPTGYTFLPSVCVQESGCYAENYDREECEEDGIYEYVGDICVETLECDADYVDADSSGSVGKICTECPAGSYCPAGSESPTACPAGSYCAGTKLGAVSGVCAIGSYSLAGATTCTSCPASDLIDANGNVVSVTTESTGATSSSACFVAKGTLFKNKKGTFKYTDNCGHGNYSEKLLCEMDNDAVWNGNYCECLTLYEWTGSKCVDEETWMRSEDCGTEGGEWNWDTETCEFE